MDVLAEVGASGGGHRDRIVRLLGGIPSADPIPLARLASLTFCPTRRSSTFLAARRIRTRCSGWCCSMPIPARYGNGRGKAPKFAYDRDIHEHCPRRPLRCRPFCEAIRRRRTSRSWCLYRWVAGARHSRRMLDPALNEIPECGDGIGAPCIGCTEKSIASACRCSRWCKFTRWRASIDLRAHQRAAGHHQPLATGVVGLARERSLERLYCLAQVLHCEG